VAALDGAPRALLPVVRRVGAERRWTEGRTEKGTPCFRLPGGGRLTFEPGGQMEISSSPARSASALLRELRDVVNPLRSAAADHGIELLAAGIDPYNDIAGVPLQLHADRYDRMAAYFATIDPAGARMMRQTASFQVTVDGDAAGEQRWRVLNAAAPFVVAIFANSPVYAGAPTDFASFRAECWRRLDPGRTGILGCGPALPAYLDFALSARDMMRRSPDGTYRPFADWLDAGLATVDEWHRHLSTLFPEVRPRGYLEVRSADAMDPAWYAAPLALLGGIAYDPRAGAAAADLLDAPDPEELRVAGAEGMRDPAIAATAAELAAIALDGCEALGDDFITGPDLDEARAFFARYTFIGRSPADDVVAPASM
jgi:glutamate--cysteine ligase